MNENTKQEEAVEQRAAKTPVEAISKTENAEVSEKDLDKVSGGVGRPKLLSSGSWD